MKRKRSISKNSTQLIIGLLLGFFVISQSTVYSLQVYTETDKKEQKGDENDSQQQLKLADAVPSSPTQISLDFQSLLLEELPKEDGEEKESALFQPDLSLGKALKILFRQIISPNAP